MRQSSRGSAPRGVAFGARRAHRGHAGEQLPRALPLLVLAACAPVPSPPTPAPPPSADQPQATASAASQAPAAPMAPPSPFSIVTEGWDVTVADTHGPVVIHDTLLGTMVTVDGERIARVEKPFQRLPTGPDVSGSITGTWPEGALLTARVGNNLRQFFRRTKGAWEAQDVTRAFGRGFFREAYIEDVGVTYHVAGPYDPGLVAFDVAGPDGRSMVFMAPTDPEQPVLSLGGDGKPRLLGRISEDKRSTVKQVTASSNGEIAVAATYLNVEARDYRWAVERWRVGQVAHTRIEVEGTRHARPNAFQVSICLARDGTLHALRHEKESGGSALLTWRGSSWTSTVIPGTRKEGPTSRCAVDREGSVWFVLGDGEEIYRSPHGQGVERVPFPTLPAATQRQRFRGANVVTEPVPGPEQVPGSFSGSDIRVADDGSLWIAGVRKEAGKVVDTRHTAALTLERKVVLRLGAPLPGTPIDWDELQAGVIEDRLATLHAVGGGASDRYFSTGPVRPGCEPVFVRLMTLPKKPPPNEDFPAVRAVVQGRADLAGTRFVEGRIENTHVLGAIVANLEAGRRVLAVLKGRIPSAGARLYCGRPHIVRAIPMGIPEEK